MTSIGSGAPRHQSAVLYLLDPRVDNDAALAHAHTNKPTDTKGAPSLPSHIPPSQVPVPTKAVAPSAAAESIEPVHLLAREKI